jgi:hypothetical protein
MKQISMMIASVTFAAVVTALIPVASAQSLPIRVRIPFPFIAADRTVQAGDYTLRPASISPGVMLLKGEEGEQGLFLSTFPLDSRRAAELNVIKVVFHRYGDRYFLSEVWTDGNKLGVWKSKQEKREQKAANVAPVEAVLVAHK